MGGEAMGRWFRIAAAAAVIHIAAAAMHITCGSAFAQTAFPSRPVHIFVPYPAGGGVDVLTRTLGESSPGNGGSPSSWRTARAPAA